MMTSVTSGFLSVTAGRLTDIMINMMKINKNRKNIAKRIILPVVILMLLYIAANAAAICNYAGKDETTITDAVIVLGAGVWDDIPSPVFQERINHGIWLYRNGYAGKLILTGGYGEGNAVSDAQIAMDYAVRQGVPAEDILIEEESRITQENLFYARQIMQANGFDSALLVSDPLHMKRAMRMAEDLGMEAYSSPTPTSRYQSVRAKAGFLAREVFFLIGYQLLVW